MYMMKMPLLQALTHVLASCSYPDKVLQGTLLGGTDLRYVDVAFSRDGTRVAAFGNRTDHLATVWNVKKNSSDDEGLTGEKVCNRHAAK